MSGMNIVGVEFRRAGKIYDFDAKDFCLSIGDRVVVETERGPSLAEVKRVSYTEFDDVEPSVLKPIVRIASRKDLDAAGRLTTEHAESFTKQKIHELDLDMRVIGVEIQFGGNKVIVYFSAPGRVDFRELVKELAGGLKTRVELKQVGSRDEAKLSGGLGICGREFCCSSFLREFVPVSIKMAKNQNLALNPSKVSGGCGRLLCCLTYEDETYAALRQQLLPKGARVRLPDGTFGDTLRGDILNQVMLVELDTGEQKSVPIVELEVVDARQAVSEEDDWGSDLDFANLLGEGDSVTALDDGEDVGGERKAGTPKGKGPIAARGPQRSDNRAQGGGRDRNEGRPPRSARPERGEPRKDRPERGEKLEPRSEGKQGGGGPQQQRGDRGDRNRGPRDKSKHPQQQAQEGRQQGEAPRGKALVPKQAESNKPETQPIAPKGKIIQSVIVPKGDGAGGSDSSES